MSSVEDALCGAIFGLDREAQRRILSRLLCRLRSSVHVTLWDDRIMYIAPVYSHIEDFSEEQQTQMRIDTIRAWMKEWGKPIGEVRVERHALLQEGGDFEVGEVLWAGTLRNGQVEVVTDTPHPVFMGDEVPWF